MAVVFDYILGKLRLRDGSDSSGLETRITNLENNEYKVAYFASVSANSGTITIPTGATILLNQFQGGIDAYISTIDTGQPTGKNPVTAGGAIVDVSSFDASGNYNLTGTPSAYPVAIIYILKISAKDFSNLTIDNILEYERFDYTAIAPITVNANTRVVSTSMSTNKLIGRYNSGTGVMEEIGLASGLSFSAGSLTLGYTTVGSSFFNLTNPGAITFPRINADNSVSALSASAFRTAIGAGTGSGDALTANPLSQFAATTSAQLRGVISDGLGTGSLLFDGATPTGFVLTNATGLPISTGLTGGTANRIPYFTSSTALSTASTFLFDGTNLGIGTTPDSILTVSKQTTIVAPVSGSTAHFIGLDANPLRITLDTHDNVNAGGTAFMLRKSRGTASSPSAVLSGDTLGTINALGYGTSQYATASTGLASFKANQLFTNTAMGTYFAIFTTPDGSVTAAEALRVTGAGNLNLFQAAGAYQINGTSVLNSSTLGSGITNSSLTTLGTISTGVWNGSVITPVYGGTGIANNAASTITISGNFATTFVTTSASSYTLPTATSTLLANNLGLSGGSTLTGGTAVGDGLNLKGTSGNGTSTVAAVSILVGNNGATTAFQMLNSAQAIFNTSGTSSTKLYDGTSGFSYLAFTTASPGSTNYSLGGDGTNLRLNAPSASGTLDMRWGGNAKYSFTTSKIVLTPTATASTVVAPFTFTMPANAGQTASTEAIGVFWDMSATVQHSTGALALQRAFVISAPTYSYVGASAATDVATLGITGAPITGTNGTTTNTHGILISTASVTSATNAYGITSNAPSGGTNNYSGNFTGGLGMLADKVISATLIGGQAVGSTISIQSTTANGTSTVAGINFLVGNNGATVAGSVYNNGNWIIGSGASTTTPRLVRIFQDTATANIGSVSNSTSMGGIGFHATTMDLSTVSLRGDGSSSWFNGTNNAITQVSGTTKLLISANTITYTPGASTSGVISGYTFTAAANTGQTAGSESVSVNWDLSAVMTHASNTGITTQRDFWIKPRTHAFASATGTITNGYSLYVEAPIAGTNSIITNPWAAAFNGDVAATMIYVGGLTTTPASLLHIAAGTSAANTAPLQIANGTRETTARAGLVEFENNWYFTKNSTLRYGVGGNIFDHNTDAGNSTTTETDLYSDTLPANTFAVNSDKVDAEYGGIFVSSGTATREIKLYFAGTVIFDTGLLTLSLSSAWTMYATVIRVSSTVVRYMVSLTTQGASSSAYTSVGELTGLTLSNTNILKITGQAAGVGAATNDIVAKMGCVAFRPAA
jgi:hypothetical protein